MVISGTAKIEQKKQNFALKKYSLKLAPDNYSFML